MAITGYTTLKTALAAWVERASDTNYTGEADTFIDMAEARFSRALVGHYRMETSSTLTTDSSGEATLPSGFLAMRTAIWQGAEYLTIKPVSWGLLQNLNPYNESDVPSQYAIRDTTLKVGPIKAGSLDISYWATLAGLSEDLSGSNETNWLFDQAPDVYLIMGLAMGHLFNENIQQAAVMEAKAMDLLSEVSGLGSMAIYAEAEMQMATSTP